VVPHDPLLQMVKIGMASALQMTSNADMANDSAVFIFFCYPAYAILS